MNGGSGADFMIHGIVKYHLFGHELWLTTTTVGMTIVTIVADSGDSREPCIKTCDGCTWNIPEYHRIRYGNAGKYDHRDSWQFSEPVCELYRNDFSVYSVLQPERSVRPENGYCRLWCYVPSWSGHVCDDVQYQGIEIMVSDTLRDCFNLSRCCSRSI